VVLALASHTRGYRDCDGGLSSASFLASSLTSLRHELETAPGVGHDSLGAVCDWSSFPWGASPAATLGFLSPRLGVGAFFRCLKSLASAETVSVMFAYFRGRSRMGWPCRMRIRLCKTRALLVPDWTLGVAESVSAMCAHASRSWGGRPLSSDLRHTLFFVL
jgi:hypothetical protein